MTVTSPLSFTYVKFKYYISFFYVIFIFFLSPIMKYYEYVHNGIRFNSTFIVLLGIVPILLFLIYSVNQKYSKWEILLLFTFSYISIYQMVSYPFIMDYSNNMSEIYFGTIANTIIEAFIFIFIGYNLEKLFSNRIYILGVQISWILFSIVIMYFTLSNDDGFYMIFNGAKIYLLIADSYTILSIFFVATLKSIKLKTVFFLICLPIIFAILSRTSLYLFFCVFMLFYFIKEKSFFFILLLLFILACTAFVLWFDLDITLISNNRMFRYILTGEDSSVNSRNEILLNGINAIKEKWYIGDFMGDVRDNSGNTGYYIHNILSILRQYGIFPFVLIITLITYSLTRVALLIKNDDQYAYLLFLLMLYCILEVFIARGFVFNMFWLPLAAIISYKGSTAFYRRNTLVNNTNESLLLEKIIKNNE